MTDTVTECGQGTYRQERGVRYIKYTTDAASVMIRAEAGLVLLHRKGDANSQMRFELGRQTDFLYKTPYGDMEMNIFTDDIVIRDGEIRLVYILDTGIDKIRNNTVIEIKE